MENNKNKKVMMCLLLSFIGMYFVFAFVNQSFDPVPWSAACRGFYIFLSVFAFYVSSLIAIDLEGERQGFILLFMKITHKAIYLNPVNAKVLSFVAFKQWSLGRCFLHRPFFVLTTIKKYHIFEVRE